MYFVLGLLSHNRKSPTTCLRISHKPEIFLWNMPIFLWWSEQNRRAQAGSRSKQYNGWSQTWFLKILKVRILNFSYFLEITRTKEIFKITERGGPPPLADRGSLLRSTKVNKTVYPRSCSDQDLVWKLHVKYDKYRNTPNGEECKLCNVWFRIGIHELSY